MADRKISQLTSAVLITGTEFIPIVQPVDDPKDNKKITINDLMDFAENDYGFVVKTRQVNTQHSIMGGGDLSSDRTLSLVNDVTLPGNNKFYGTDGSGTKGWFDIIALGNANYWKLSGSSVLTGATIINISGNDLSIKDVSTGYGLDIDMPNGDINLTAGTALGLNTSSTGLLSVSVGRGLFTSSGGSSVSTDFKAFTFSPIFNRSTGTNIYRSIDVSPIYNFTGTYLGAAIYGIDYNPTITSLPGSTIHIAARFASGQMILGPSLVSAFPGRLYVEAISNRVAQIGNFEINNASNPITTGLGIRIDAANRTLQLFGSNLSNTGDDASITVQGSTFATNRSLVDLSVMKFVLNFQSTTFQANSLSAIKMDYALPVTTIAIPTMIGIDYNPTTIGFIGVHHALRIRRGMITVGSSVSTPVNIFSTSGDSSGINDEGLALVTRTTFSNNNQNHSHFWFVGGSSIHTQSSGSLMTLTNTFVVSSGTGSYRHLSLTPTINTTGTYIGTAYGVDYNPTLNSVTGLTHIAARFVSGKVIVGLSTLADASSSVQIEADVTTGNALYMRKSGGAALTHILGGNTVTFSVASGTSYNFTIASNVAIGIDSDLGLNIGAINSINNSKFRVNRSSTGSGSTIYGVLFDQTINSSTDSANIEAFRVNPTFSTSNNVVISRFLSSWAPASSNKSFTSILISPTYNTTSSYAGTIIGLDYAPTVTALTATTNHYAALFRSGRVGIGNITPIAILQVKGVDATSANYAVIIENSVNDAIAKFRNDLALELGGTSAILEVNTGIISGNAAIRFLSDQALAYRFQDSALNDYLNFRSTTADKALIVRQPIEYDFGQTEKRITDQYSIQTNTTADGQTVVFEFTLADGEHYDIKVLHATAIATDGTTIGSHFGDSAICHKLAASNIDGAGELGTQERRPTSVTTGGFNWNFDTATQKVQYRFQNTTGTGKTFVIWVEISYVKRLTPEV